MIKKGHSHLSRQHICSPLFLYRFQQRLSEDYQYPKKWLTHTAGCRSRLCPLAGAMYIYVFVTSVPASSSRSHEVLYHDSPRSLFSALSQCFGPPFFPTACAGVGQTIGLCTGGCMSLPPGERESSWQHQPHLWNDRGFLSTHLGNNAAGLLQSALPCKYPYPGYGRTEQLSSPRACAKHGVPIVRKEWW